MWDMGCEILFYERRETRDQPNNLPDYSSHISDLTSHIQFVVLAEMSASSIGGAPILDH
jgi:hypothetical protein